MNSERQKLVASACLAKLFASFGRRRHRAPSAWVRRKDLKGVATNFVRAVSGVGQGPGSRRVNADSHAQLSAHSDQLSIFGVSDRFSLPAGNWQRQEAAG